VLRIVRQDRGTHRVVLILEGRIVMEWADALEDECRDLIRSGYRVVLDLSGVNFIGPRGVDVLDRLGWAGVEIKGCSPIIADLLEHEGIKVTRRREDLTERVVPWKRKCGADA